MRAVKHWKRLPSKAVESPFLETSKMWTDKAPSYHIKLRKLVPTLELAWLNVMGYRASFQHKLFCSVILCCSIFLSLKIQFNSYNKASLKLSQYLNGFIPRLLAVPCFYQDERNWTARYLHYDFLLFSHLLNICLTVIPVYTTLTTITSPVRVL